MSEQGQQRWRIQLGRHPYECTVYLNDELWTNVVSLKIEAGVDSTGKARPTLLTFSLHPREIQVDIEPSLQGAIEDGLFNPRA